MSARDGDDPLLTALVPAQQTMPAYYYETPEQTTGLARRARELAADTVCDAAALAAGPPDLAPTRLPRPSTPSGVIVALLGDGPALEEAEAGREADDDLVGAAASLRRLLVPPVGPLHALLGLFQQIRVALLLRVVVLLTPAHVAVGLGFDLAGRRLQAGAGQAVLSQDGLVTRTAYAEVPPRVEYALTPPGLSLHHIVTSLITWVADHHSQIREHRARTATAP
ncbi:winged helix-turn-helix transcriptional regulator [Saccharothrix sp. ALI-22-I]|uniref:winged helix-turn-helix transcriptional regulator n=1 Tax=Saccharothrix sp. ALI-22-I TaxID=1933778 RepID=UPI001EE6AB23|nr:helix-turn-helix domain-containing protein [Saccharothrix sp. ALI-22-I]